MLLKHTLLLLSARSAALLTTLSRLLAFNDGAILASGRVPPSASGFARLSTSLPALQAKGWSLLSLLLRASGSSLLPLLPTVTRLLGEQLRRVVALGPVGLAAQSALVRASVYAAVHAACEARGVGAARLLGAAAMGAAEVELYGWAVQVQGGHKSWGGASGSVRAGNGGGSKQAAKRARLSGAVEAVESAETGAAAAAAAVGAFSCLAVGSGELEAQLAALQMVSVRRT